MNIQKLFNFAMDGIVIMAIHKIEKRRHVTIRVDESCFTQQRHAFGEPKMNIDVTEFPDISEAVTKNIQMFTIIPITLNSTGFVVQSPIKFAGTDFISNLIAEARIIFDRPGSSRDVLTKLMQHSTSFNIVDNNDGTNLELFLFKYGTTPIEAPEFEIGTFSAENTQVKRKLDCHKLGYVPLSHFTVETRNELFGPLRSMLTLRELIEMPELRCKRIIPGIKKRCVDELRLYNTYLELEKHMAPDRLFLTAQVSK